jgi:hypothetical protein
MRNCSKDKNNKIPKNGYITDLAKTVKSKKGQSKYLF